MAEVFGVLPAHMERLRPSELDDMRTVLKARDKAARDEARRQH